MNISTDMKSISDTNRPKSKGMYIAVGFVCVAVIGFLISPLGPFNVFFPPNDEQSTVDSSLVSKLILLSFD